MTEGEQHAKIWNAISKTEKFGPGDLRALRESLASVHTFTQPGQVMIASRLSVEVIDALMSLDHSIHKLDETSANLITTTNKLTQRILWLTVVAIVIALAAFAFQIL